MKSFTQFIYEKSEINYTDSHDREHGEIHDQYGDLKHNKDTPDHVKKMLHRFKDPHKFSAAMKTGKTVKITRNDSVGNSMHQDKDATPDPKKAKRVANLIKNKQPIERPIVARHKSTGKRWLISGAHRAHHITQSHGHFQAHEIEYDG